MAPEPLIGGLTAEQLVDKAAGQAFAQAMATASLNARQVSASERSLFKLATVMGATAMYRELVALGKDLLDPAPATDREAYAGLDLSYLNSRCTCPDIEVRTLGQEPGTGDTVKGLAPDCPIHGAPRCTCAPHANDGTNRHPVPSCPVHKGL